MLLEQGFLSGRGDSERRIFQFMQGLQVDGAEKGLYRMKKEGKNDRSLAGNMIMGRNQVPACDIPPSSAQFLLFWQEAS